MTKLDMSDWRSWALLYAAIDQLDVIAERISESGDVTDEDVKNLTELVGHFKEFRPDKD